MKKRPRSSVENVKNTGGRDVILNRMVNHYKTIINIKSNIDNKPLPPHVNSIHKNGIFRLKALKGQQSTMII